MGLRLLTERTYQRIMRAVHAVETIRGPRVTRGSGGEIYIGDTPQKEVQAVQRVSGGGSSIPDGERANEVLKWLTDEGPIAWGYPEWVNTTDT